MHITYNGGCNCFTFVVVVVYCILPVERCRWRRLRWCFGVCFFRSTEVHRKHEEAQCEREKGKTGDETENEHNNKIGAEVANANIRQSFARSNGFLRSSAVSRTVHSHTIVGIAGSEHTSHDICWPLGAALVRLQWPESIAFRVGWVDCVLNSWRLIAQIWENMFASLRQVSCKSRGVCDVCEREIEGESRKNMTKAGKHGISLGCGSLFPIICHGNGLMTASHFTLLIKLFEVISCNYYDKLTYIIYDFWIYCIYIRVLLL